jgi:hypothetical protein
MKEPFDFEPPVERFSDLPAETRRMLESLRPDEVAFLQRMIRTMSAFGTVGKFVAIVAGALIGLLIGVPAVIDALMRIASWFPHKGP